MNRLIIALLGSVLYSGASMAQKQTYFTNPVIHGDVADPSILRIDDIMQRGLPPNGLPTIRYSHLKT